MFRAKHPRLLLNEIKWRFDLSRCRVYYVHRGAPGDMKIVEGSEIKNIERGFLILIGEMQDVYIPYHRIFRIDFNDQIIFQRKRSFINIKKASLP
jgi:uncharacterized protein (UPF0248 family)